MHIQMILQLNPLDCVRNILDEYSKHTLFGEEPVTYLMMLILVITIWQS